MLLPALACALLLAPASSAERGALPRATADRPDESGGRQVHFLYVVPSDGPDRELDTNGYIEGVAARMQAWLEGQTAGRKLRIDTFQGQSDVSFVRIPPTTAEIAAGSDGFASARLVQDAVRAAGFNTTEKLYAAYVDGRHSTNCGFAPAGSPTGNAIVVGVYREGPRGACADTSPYSELLALHEIVHGLGFVAPCAPNFSGNHVTGPPNDLMYAGTEPWDVDAMVLDEGHDDYFEHDNADCRDLADSLYLEGSEPLTLRITVKGSGRVTSYAVGVSCPPACEAELDRGSSVTLRAAAATGFRFTGWSGACTGTRATCTVTMDESRQVRATFVAVPKCKKGQKPTKKKPCR